MKRILFVDAEPESFRRLSAQFVDRAADWEAAFVRDAEEGLRTLFKEPFDVVVSGLALPGMDGGDFLSVVMQRYPNIVRMLLTDDEDHSAGLRLAGTAHRDLPRGCDPEEFRRALEHALGLRELLANDKLKRLVGQVLSLPSMPELYLKLLDELRLEEPSTDRIAAVITRDPAMSAKLLQLVNSAFFGLASRISSPTEAVLYLGQDTIKALVLSLQFFALFERVRIPEFSFESLWRHSWAVGMLARKIARKERADASVIERTFTAGLLHDAGKLVLASGLPEQYQLALRERQIHPELTLSKVEENLFGATHAEVGAYLLALWGLPDVIVEAVALHHAPARGGAAGFTPVIAVHAANVLEHLVRRETQGVSPLDTAFLQQIGLDNRLHAWRELAGETDDE